MKKSIFLGILYLLLSAPLAGSEVLSRRLSVSFHETPLKQALDEVARLADFEWSYNVKILDAGRRVTFTAKDWTVREILRAMLGESFVFKSNGRYLILKKEPASNTRVSGVIRSTQSGERLANVTVYDRRTLRATTTDSSGYYQLKVKKKTELVIVGIGYRDTILQVNSMNPEYRNFELSPVPIPAADSSLTLRESLQKAATELDYFFKTALNKWHDLNVPDTLSRRFQFSFLPMVGTNHVLSAKVQNDWSVNVLAGQSAGVRYFEAAGLGNFTRKQVRGFQAAGVFNLNRGNCRGVQAAGLYNQTADTLEGAQFAGLINTARLSPHFSLQAAGFINIIRKSADADTTSKPPKCVQLAGFYNKSHQMEGVQAAGFINTAKEMNGVQAAGFINKATNVNGAQVAGGINVSRRVRGIQIGVVNSADHLHGIQIGLLNRSGKRWLPFFNWGKSR